ncbi:MAG: mismatch-specific DNA-glycosylase [Stellaceae bacterium]
MEAEDRGSGLPDLLRDGLDVVFVGINPSIFSAVQGHYFARRTNRFWPCFSRSSLSLRARQRLGLTQLEPMHDRLLLDDGFGFTDAVKRATARAADLTLAELASGVPLLVAKIERYEPKIACFHGVTAYRQVHRAITGLTSHPGLGPQALRIARTRLFVVPNPSPANAHYTPADQTRWYDRLARYAHEIDR